MQNLYQVITRYSLPLVGADFEYQWFVYQRDDNTYIPEPNQLSGTIAAKNKIALQVISELFTYEEACQLKTVLEALYAEFDETIEFNIAIEEVDITKLSDHSPLKESYQDGGEFVDPYGFAEFHCNNLDFLVAAAVNNEIKFKAEDFLKNLAEGRLEALRQMHAENNG